MRSCRSHTSTWRTLPNWRNLRKTSSIALRIRRSGSISMRSFAARMKPTATFISTSPRLLHEGFVGSLAQCRELHLRERTLHAQKESVVGLSRIVDAVFIDDERIHQPAKLEQCVPVPSVAGQP